MKEYKRFTEKVDSGFVSELDCRIAYNKLVAIEDKFENGTLIELPILIGQTIYRKDAHFSWTITEARIYEDEIVFYDDSDNMIQVEDIGKKVFLTKAEAEQKRKENKNVKNL